MKNAEDILKEFETVIRLNRELQDGARASKDWTDSLGSLNQQIGLKLKELMDLHERLSSHLQNSKKY